MSEKLNQTLNNLNLALPKTSNKVDLASVHDTPLADPIPTPSNPNIDRKVQNFESDSAILTPQIEKVDQFQSLPQMIEDLDTDKNQSSHLRTSAFSQNDFLNRDYEAKEIKKSVSVSFETDDRLETFIKDYKRGVRGQKINAKMDFQDLCSYIIKKFLAENNF